MSIVCYEQNELTKHHRITLLKGVLLCGPEISQARDSLVSTSQVQPPPPGAPKSRLLKLLQRSGSICVNNLRNAIPAHGAAWTATVRWPRGWVVALWRSACLAAAGTAAVPSRAASETAVEPHGDIAGHCGAPDAGASTHEVCHYVRLH